MTEATIVWSFLPIIEVGGAFILFCGMGAAWVANHGIADYNDALAAAQPEASQSAATEKRTATAAPAAGWPDAEMQRRAFSTCRAAKSLFEAWSDPRNRLGADGEDLVDSVEIRASLSAACACGRCDDIEAAIERIRDIEIDGWPYKSATTILLRAFDAMGPISAGVERTSAAGRA